MSCKREVPWGSQEFYPLHRWSTCYNTPRRQLGQRSPLWRQRNSIFFLGNAQVTLFPPKEFTAQASWEIQSQSTKGKGVVREAFIQETLGSAWSDSRSWLGFANFFYPPHVSGANLLMPSGSHGPCPASTSAQSDLTTTYTVDKEAVRTTGMMFVECIFRGWGQAFLLLLSFHCDACKYLPTPLLRCVQGLWVVTHIHYPLKVKEYHWLWLDNFAGKCRYRFHS